MKVLITKWSIGVLSVLLFTLPCFTRGEVSSFAMPVNLYQRCEAASQYRLLTNNTDAPPNAWRGLIPLHSTRADVERVLGKPKWSHGSTFIHETECERVDVIYSKGACEPSGMTRWNVPADVVIKLEVAPRNKILVKDLKFDLNRYLRNQESHPENWVLYRSVEDGIRLRAILDEKDETVMVVTYEPRTKDKVLQCSSTK
jgi:hypothetical protein